MIAGGPPVKLGVALGLLNPAFHEPVAVRADALGFESAWLPEHVIFPATMSGSPHPGDAHPPVPPTTPVFDAFAVLSHLAARTERLRLGTHVYLLALRHPFVAARAVQTLDLLSGGRAEVGVGAGWLREEWEAMGLDFATRGRRLDEALAVCRKLWSQETVAHDGAFFRFDAVAFEPKPRQKPWPPIWIGGESDAALRRAARRGEGWIGLEHTPESVKEPIARLRAHADACGRTDRVRVTVSARAPDRTALAGFAAAGVERVIVAPWRRSPDALASLDRYARDVDLPEAAA